MTSSKKLKLFEAYGIELEYMIVNKDTLDVLPVTDEVIKSVMHKYVGDADMGPIEWSNELVLHVIELKTNGPANDLTKLPKLFHDNVLHINKILDKLNGKLMPGAMHPWMDPSREVKLWPHDSSEIYDAYNKIFNCTGHGWSNLQSVHINLPFANDEEFGRLHAAVRLVLPLIPALAASSPVKENCLNGFFDNRLEVYRKNQAKVPSIVGHVVPEPVFSKKEYNEVILKKLYRDISEFDTEGILQEEWLNSRGAIARFDRNTIEIRLIDIQECPQADIAIAAFLIEIIKTLVNEEWCSYENQKKFSETHLSDILLSCIHRGENAMIKSEGYLKTFDIHHLQTTGGDMLMNIFQKIKTRETLAPFIETIETILKEGTLSSRIIRSLTISDLHNSLKEVYSRMCDCLNENKMFK